MRFLSFAGAVLVALAATGCGRSSSTSSPPGEKKGPAAPTTLTFVMEVRGETAVLDPDTSTTVVLPGGGLVTSSVGGIDCGVVGGALHKACKASIDYGAKGVLVTATPDAGSGYALFSWAGACTGPSPCKVDVTTNRLVVVRFAKTAGALGAHPDFSEPTIHGPEYFTGKLGCAGCHGAFAPSCGQCHAFPFDHPGLAGGDCGACHAGVWADWASVLTSLDKHAASAVDVLLNVEHDSSELLVDACLNCHSMPQRVAGMTIDQLVSPISTVVPQDDVAPEGTWTLRPGASAWQATRCEVCHDVTSTEKGKLAKLGAILDQDPSVGVTTYFAASSLPQPAQSVLDPSNDTYADTPYVSTTAVAVAAVKICCTCHDPADQGGGPNKVVGGHDYGPQGGDSRAFVTASHAGLSCIDCHPTHDFTPVDPDARPACGTTGCHDVSKVGTSPGVVHTNHIP
jgi:hypothetical protein